MENKSKIRELTSKEELCSSRCCPAIFDKEGKTYLLVGKKVNPKEFKLGDRVGDDEVLIEVPKGIIDNKLD